VTTWDPGARLVFTHGWVASPAATAFRASSPAATITAGLDVFVHDVMAAMATAPWSSVDERATAGAAVKVGGSLAGKDSWLASSTPSAGGAGDRSASISRSTAWNRPRALASGIRSWGRRGPASDGSTVDRSSRSSSGKRSRAVGSCHNPCSLAYRSTAATCSGSRPVKRR
jgi:hypothetical protein